MLLVASACLGGALGIVYGVIVTVLKCEKSWQREAVETGHAEYVLDGDKAAWRWKDVQVKEPGDE